MVFMKRIACSLAPRRGTSLSVARRSNRPLGLHQGAAQDRSGRNEAVPAVPPDPGTGFHEDGALDLSPARKPMAGRGQVGKLNAVNNYCIALPSNEPRHRLLPRRLWVEGRFVSTLSNADNIDLASLLSHDTNTASTRSSCFRRPRVTRPTSRASSRRTSGNTWQPPDLEAIAKSVGMPTRQLRGACHFFGGGGDHVKHGDLDSSMAKPPPGRWTCTWRWTAPT